MGEKIGKDRLYKYICAFGFGEKTQIGLPGEAKGSFTTRDTGPPLLWTRSPSAKGSP